MKGLRGFWSAAAASVLLAGLTTACNSPRGGTRTEGQMMDDRQLTRLVETRLRNDPVYKYQGVDVKTFNRTVQLSGFVDSDVQKQRAEQLASQIPGVENVENAVMVKPLAEGYETIGRDLRRAKDLPYPVPGDITQTGSGNRNTIDTRNQPNTENQTDTENRTDANRSDTSNR